MNKKIFPLVIFLFILVLSGCNLPLQEEEAPATAAPPPEPTATVEVVETEAIPTEIVHNLVPLEFLPAKRANHAGDHDSSETANQKHPPGGDRWSRGTWERPFNANTMDVYFPYLDIIDNEIFEDDTWVYVAVTMRGLNDNQSLPGQYYVEIDQNRDGRGDWLVGVYEPSGTEWTSKNVRVWWDSNDDNGGNNAYRADENPPYSDGYELLVYDQGEGNYPDAAFARISSENPHIIQIAFQKVLFGEGTLTLLIGTFAGSNLDPAMFDFNDHLTHEQTGAADPGLEIFYPIKELSEMDNACRMPLGFAATGQEPGLCPSAAPPGAPPVGCNLKCPDGYWLLEDCTCETLY